MVDTLQFYLLAHVLLRLWDVVAWVVLDHLNVFPLATAAYFVEALKDVAVTVDNVSVH